MSRIGKKLINIPKGVTVTLNENVLTEDRALEIDKLAKEEANASAEFAAASPDPDPSELMDDIYWETDNPELKTSEGRIFFEHP